MGAMVSDRTAEIARQNSRSARLVKPAKDNGMKAKRLQAKLRKMDTRNLGIVRRGEVKKRVMRVLSTELARVRRPGPKERVSLFHGKTRCRNRNSKAWIHHITGLDYIVNGLFGAQGGPFGTGDSLQ